MITEAQTRKRGKPNVEAGNANFRVYSTCSIFWDEVNRKTLMSPCHILGDGDGSLWEGLHAAPIRGTNSLDLASSRTG